jgi:pimeloyl-ACP methyl ester carboxylesterase
VAQAERYRATAQASTTVAGRTRAYRGAAACYHWAEFMDFDDAERKFALRFAVRDCFRRSMEGTDLDIVEDVLPPQDPQGPAVPYWVILPRDRREGRPLPCVVLSNGLDSMTEVEVLSLAEAYLERGIAAVLFDGPGQGINAGRSPLRIDMATVVEALLERLGKDDTLDTGRLAFLGVSFGGYLALRVAQTLGDRFRCVVNLSGGPRVAPFAGLPRRLKDDFRFAFASGDAGDMQARFDALAIDPDAVAETCVLSVHGGLDDIFPIEALRELDRAWGAHHDLWVHPTEAHVCLSRINTWSLEAADWVAERLAIHGTSHGALGLK